jgi:hypothetical protein
MLVADPLQGAPDSRNLRRSRVSMHYLAWSVSLSMLTQHCDCFECERLWSDYKAATQAVFRLDNKLSIAEIRHDSAVVATLTPETNEAVRLRLALRLQILNHGAEAHGQSAVG